MNMGEAYRTLKRSGDWGLDRVMDWSNDVAMRAYGVSLPSLRRVVQKSARSLSDVSLLLKNSPRLDSWRLVGSDWSIIYVGSEASKSELNYILFSQVAAEVNNGRVNIWRLPQLVMNWLAECELVVCELSRWYPWSFQTTFAFTVPPWIRQTMDISGSEEAILSAAQGDLRRNLKRITKYGFTYEFSQSKSDFDRFYEQMYVPYTKVRYGERSGIISYESLWRNWFSCDGCGLIQLKCDQQVVAGMGCRMLGETCFAGATGILNSNFDLVKKGAAVALFWFAIDWARKQGASTFDFGRTRSRQADGVFYSKQRWNARIVSCYSTVHENWCFLSNSLSPQLRRFLNDQGFITEVRGRHYSVLLTDGTGTLPPSFLDKQKQDAQRNGLEGILIVGPHHNQVISIT